MHQAQTSIVQILTVVTKRSQGQAWLAPLWLGWLRNTCNNSLTTYDVTDTLYRSRTRSNSDDGVNSRPAPLIQIPSQYDLLLLNTTLVDMFNIYI